MRSWFKLSVGVALAVGAASLSPGSVLRAQSGDPTEENGYVCLVRSGQGPDGAVEETKVKVLASREALLSGRGFARTGCTEAEKWLRAAGPSMCALADVNDAAFVSQFMNTHGLTPAEICTLMNELPGA